MKRSLIKKVRDKIVRKTTGGKMLVGNYNIKLDRNHNLSSVLERYPDYGSNLVRLAKYIDTKYKNLKIFDIGGNIGDTVAMLLSGNPNYEIMSIEGNEKYFKILTENFGTNKSVKLCKKFLGETNETIIASEIKQEGTLKLDTSITAKASETAIITLDSLIARNPDFKGAKLLKIDTDGFDNKIIRGSKDYLTKTKPAIYFEYDSQSAEENKLNPLNIFIFLEEHGYKDAAFFDNYGRFILSTTLRDKKILNQLSRYTGNQMGSFAFYDIVVFHEQDSDIAESFIQNEMQRK